MEEANSKLQYFLIRLISVQRNVGSSWTKTNLYTSTLRTIKIEPFTVNTICQLGKIPWYNSGYETQVEGICKNEKEGIAHQIQEVAMPDRETLPAFIIRQVTIL